MKAEVFRYAEEKEDTKATAAIDEALKDVDATGVDDFDLSGDLSGLLDIGLMSSPLTSSRCLNGRVLLFIFGESVVPWRLTQKNSSAEVWVWENRRKETKGHSFLFFDSK